MQVRSIIVAALMLVSGFAFAASVPLLTAPVDPGQQQANLNNLIAAVNLVLSPLTGGSANNPLLINTISLAPALTGQPAIIALAPGADANASIGLSSNGDGDIVLFAGNTGSAGVVQFANAAAFVPANGFAACPGGDLPQLNVAETVTGYLVFKDWLGVTRGIPAC